MTVAELLASGMPAILVPLPGAPRDHQTRNAAYLVNEGAALMIPERELSVERLVGVLAPLCAGRGRLLAMAERARLLARTEATKALARACVELAMGTP